MTQHSSLSTQNFTVSQPITRLLNRVAQQIVLPHLQIGQGSWVRRMMKMAVKLARAVELEAALVLRADADGLA